MPGGTASAKALTQGRPDTGRTGGHEIRAAMGMGAAYMGLTGDCKNLPGLSLGVV